MSARILAAVAVVASAAPAWGEPLQSPAPMRVPGVERAVDVRIDDDYACALDAAGRVTCWGAGLPTTQVATNVKRFERAAGSTCWIDRATNQLFKVVPQPASWDDRTWEARPELALPKGTVSVAASLGFNGGYVCAVNAKSRVQCHWEDEPPETWTAIPLPGRLRELHAGTRTPCALLRDGTVACYRRRERTMQRLPREAPAASTIALGFSAGLLLTRDRRVWRFDLRATSVSEVPALRGATAVAHGFDHRCAIVAGRVQCSSGTDEPTPATGPITAVAVTAGHRSTCLVNDTGYVWCWRNRERQ